MVPEKFLEKIPDTSYFSDSFAIVPTNGTYKEIEARVRDLTKINDEIEEQFKIEKSTAQKIKLIIKNKIFKTEIKSLDELLDKQLKNVDSLGLCLDSINKESRKELERQEEYYDNISINFEKRIRNTGEKKEDLMYLVNQFKELKLDLESIKKADINYFSKERKLREIRRELKEEKHRYIINNNNIIDLGQEKNSLEIIDDFFRSSIHVCEKVSNKISNMKKHIENTKRVYRNLRQQHKTISNMGGAIKLITDYSSHVQDTLSNDLLRINKMLTEPNFINDFYKNPILKDTSIQIETTNNHNDLEIDDIIKDYLLS